MNKKLSPKEFVLSVYPSVYSTCFLNNEGYWHIGEVSKLGKGEWIGHGNTANTAWKDAMNNIKRIRLKKKENERQLRVEISGNDKMSV